MGTVHGGVFCDLGGAAIGYVYASTLDAEESFTTLELDAKFLKPVWEGRSPPKGPSSRAAARSGSWSVT